MNMVIGGGRASARAALGTVGAAMAGACLAAGPPACAKVEPAAARPAAGGKVEVTYSVPRISANGTEVTWRWRLRNRTGRTAYRVVVTHTVKPAVPISSPNRACRKVAEGVVRCAYPSLRAKQSRTGTLVARLPENLEGGVNLAGKVAWRRTARQQDGPDRPAGRPTRPADDLSEPQTTPAAAPQGDQTAPADPRTPRGDRPPRDGASPRAEASAHGKKPRGRTKPRSKGRHGKPASHAPRAKAPRAKAASGKAPRSKAVTRGKAKHGKRPQSKAQHVKAQQQDKMRPRRKEPREKAVPAAAVQADKAKPSTQVGSMHYWTVPYRGDIPAEDD
ncbi:hypothetical protein Acsp04_38230 [Actinomadura sp. NBRC 104425]|uniref:hypothetical protein n=1 Tax=Actinomadura sp. NBRC 104425 TaxID=3032204 RepID=UPI0024A3F92E|nr:hypothetical protein [Actinomadura sp. NBRC 104425]GLZ13588.1 hypothetical protein Acsp04_38230 [Actinomadura sp. NBRC 104425]